MKKIITYVILVALLFSVGLIAEPLDGQPLQKNAATTAGQVTRSLSNISNWAYWVYRNGQSAHAPDGSSGGIYPRATAGAIYQDGFVWGGKYDENDGDIRVGGQTYNIGTQPGWVITGGEYDDSDVEVADPSDPAVRVYRIRPDYESLTHSQLIQDAAEQNSTDPTSVTTAMTQEIIDQYALDWEEWPVEHGAPYYDHDNDGAYTPDVDEPGIAQADQVVWYVVNDYSVSATTGLYGSNPVGIELQSTLWAYNQPGVRLGQIIFKSFKLINKSGKTVSDMYVSQWSDPDVGGASNDFAGCDTSLSLGYAYNGETNDADYAAFDLAPAAIGYDFFQGPIVSGAAGDTAIFELEYVPGYKNLPMTSFGWFAAGSNITDPPLGEYEGTLMFYNLIRGYIPTDDVLNPTPWRIGNVSSNATTMYPLSGDPVAGTGDLDGENEYFNPGDRRICLSSGPFDFEPGDVQEIVVAVVGGLGADNIGSVADLKTTDAVAQELFDGLFREVPKPPVSPNVTARPLENTVSLEWGSDKDRVAEIEDPVVSGYEFEGYNVYQLPSSSATKDQAKRIATFDVKNGIKLIYETRTPNEYEGKKATVPIIYGDDTGIQRYIVIDWDYVNDRPLLEGSTYYFAVTAYNQNHDEGRLAEKAMESSMIPLGVTLQEPLPGNAINTAPESDVPVVHSAGPGDGQVGVTVVDPFAITGHDYKITFNYNADSSVILYDVTDVTENAVVSNRNSQVSTLDQKGGAPIVDGVEVKVSGPELGLKSVQQFDAATDALVDNGVSILEFSLGPPGYIVSNLAGDVNLGDFFSDFDRFDIWGMDDIEINFSESSVAWDYLGDVCLTEKVPFSVYRHNFETGEKERLFIAIYDDGYGDADAADGLGVWDTTGTDGIFGATTYEPIYAYVGPEPYDPEKEADYIAADNIMAAPSNTGWGSPTNPFGYPFLNSTLIVDYFGNSADPEMDYKGYPDGDKIMFSTNKINTLADEYSFSTAGLDPTSSDSLMALAIEKINVFPNPYYAYNEQSTSAYDQYVTFTHLPEKATIRIFNLAGVLVSTVEHDNASTQFAKWDLTNKSNIPVGSGMYIAHIDMPDLGEQKVLKFMVVQNKQILEYY